MQETGLSPNQYTYSSILGIIADLTNLQEGQKIHTQLMVTAHFNSRNITIYRTAMETWFTFQ